MLAHASLDSTSEPVANWVADLIAAVQDYSAPLSEAEAKTVFNTVVCSPAEALAVAKFDYEAYARFKIFESKALEILILGWLPGQATPLHNHRGSLCAVKVLSGEASEILYERSSSGFFVPSNINLQAEGEASATYDEDVHQVANASAAPLVTLHLYSPPLKDAEYFSSEESLVYNGRPGKNVG